MMATTAFVRLIVVVVVAACNVMRALVGSVVWKSLVGVAGIGVVVVSVIVINCMSIIIVKACIIHTGAFERRIRTRVCW
jgi:hypothetical protein